MKKIKIKRGNRRPGSNVQKKMLRTGIKEEKAKIIKFGLLGLRLQKEKEKTDRERINKLKTKIEQKFPHLEELFKNDDHFSKLVCKLILNLHLISTNRSKSHTIRTLRTTAKNHQQSELRKKIIEYAKKNTLLLIKQKNGYL